MGIWFLKGHGTKNDFVLLPDPHGTLGTPPPGLVRQICDRRAGLGADGLVRVVRTAAADDPAAIAARGEAEWFMDYYNADGSISEMCGNGVRVLGRYLADREGVDTSRPLPVATRAGVKVLTFHGEEITVDMGRPGLHGSTEVGVPGHTWPAVNIDMGNPHAVAFVDDLAGVGPLTEAPSYDEATYPDGVNVEFVVRRGAGHVAMRVHERGAGETWSCGTGACAVMVASALADGTGRGASYVVELPGGTLRIDWTDDDRILMTGPAVLVAEGNWLVGR